MPDQNLVDKVRSETYQLEIHKAFDNKNDSIELYINLLKSINKIYRYLEPHYYRGKLVVFKTIDDRKLLPEKDAEKLYDFNVLINETSDSIVIQVFSNNSYLIWRNENINVILSNGDTLSYLYDNKKEMYYANGTKIPIRNYFNCASIYSLQYHYLDQALNDYKTKKIRHSSCSIFKKAWYDENRVFFKNGPEEKMQISLKEHLSSRLRGVEVVREYNLDAGKPVDIRVYWKEANRAALIEMKWLGKSKRKDGTFSCRYDNSQAVGGAKQIIEYLDLDKKDTPDCITRGFLVVIDGRRRGTNENTQTVNRKNGMYYANNELKFDSSQEFHKKRDDFEKPFRMFAEPLCKE